MLVPSQLPPSPVLISTGVACLGFASRQSFGAEGLVADTVALRRLHVHLAGVRAPLVSRLHGFPGCTAGHLADLLTIRVKNVSQAGVLDYRALSKNTGFRG